MTLLEVCEWLETFNLFDHYYIGKIDGTQENVLGVYARASSGRPVHALGQPSSYVITGIKLLVHGNQDENETQELAKNLYKALTDYPAQWVGENYIYYVSLQCQEPIDVGTDTNWIYEFVINLNIYSNRRN